MQEIIVGIINDYYNFKVLIVENINLAYFDWDEKVIIHDDNLFELRTIIDKIAMDNFKWCGNIFNLHGGSQFSG